MTYEQRRAQCDMSRGGAHCETPGEEELRVTSVKEELRVKPE